MTAAPDTEGINVERNDDVLRLVLDRPERKNSLTPAAVQVMIDAIESRPATDDRLRAIVITGSGPDFCAGADWVASNAGDAPKPRTGSLQRRTALQAHRLIEAIMSVQLPVVCGVRGWAAGLGCQLALAADFTVAASSSRFWEPFTSRGFTPDSGATWLLPRLVGVARAKELLLLGRELSGDDAATAGMIYRAVPDDALDAAVADLVAELAGAATVAIGLAKRTINRGLDSTLAEALENEALALELSSRTADFREGFAAFKERREPRFEGR